MHGNGGSAGRDGELGKFVGNMCHDGSNGGRGLPDAPMVLALTRYRGYHRAWLLLVVIAVYASLAVEAVAQDGVATDRAALVELYDATGGETWRNSTNWKTDAPLGEWYGVATGTGGRVTWLSLNYNYLTGPIPPELGDLTNLRYLSLSNNELTGPIPEWLGDRPVQPHGAKPRLECVDRADSAGVGRLDQPQVSVSQQQRVPDLWDRFRRSWATWGICPTSVYLVSQ